MKKTLVILSILAGATGLYAQGTMNWSEQGSDGWFVSIYSPQTATPTVVQTGDSPQDIPVGTTTYTGGFIGGSSSPGANGSGVGATPTSGPGGYNYVTQGNFEVGLYVDTSIAALTTDITSGTPRALASISDGAYAISGGGTVTITGITTTPVYVGLAAWYDHGGAASYAAAVTAQVPAGYNESANTLTLTTGTGTPVTITSSLGLTSFSLATASSVPEPSTIALGVIGASAFLMRLRRKQ